jgi:hypothetical protein
VGCPRGVPAWGCPVGFPRRDPPCGEPRGESPVGSPVGCSEDVATCFECPVWGSVEQRRLYRL